MDISKLYAELRNAGYTDEQALCKLQSDIKKEANKAAIAYEAEQAKKAKAERTEKKLIASKGEIKQALYKYYSLKGFEGTELKNIVESVINCLDSFGVIAYKIHSLPSLDKFFVDLS